MKNIRDFYLEIFRGFLLVKFSMYLNRCVFVMFWEMPGKKRQIYFKLPSAEMFSSMLSVYLNILSAFYFKADTFSSLIFLWRLFPENRL